MEGRGKEWEGWRGRAGRGDEEGRSEGKRKRMKERGEEANRGLVE